MFSSSARYWGLAFVLSAACTNRPDSSTHVGVSQQASSEQLDPVPCPPNALHQLESPDGGTDGGGEPASNFDTCSWAGWSSLTFQADDGEFFAISGDSQNEKLTTELAQTIHPWAQNARPGTVGLILKLARNTSSEFSSNSLLIDLVGPLTHADAGSAPDITVLANARLIAPLSYVGQSVVDIGVESSAPLLATGRFDTSGLQVGVDTTIEVPLYASTPTCTVAQGPDQGASACNVAAGSFCDPGTCVAGNCHCTPPLINYADAGVGTDAGIVYNEYALVFHMEGPANDILIAGNDGTEELAGDATYALNCPEPGVPECEGAPPGVYLPDGGTGFNQGLGSLPLGYVYLRQERFEPVFNPVTMTTELDVISSPWIQNESVAVNFYMTVNDGPSGEFDAGTGF